MPVVRPGAMPPNAGPQKAAPLPVKRPAMPAPVPNAGFNNNQGPPAQFNNQGPPAGNRPQPGGFNPG